MALVVVRIMIMTKMKKMMMMMMMMMIMITMIVFKKGSASPFLAEKGNADLLTEIKTKLKSVKLVTSEKYYKR